MRERRGLAMRAAAIVVVLAACAAAAPAQDSGTSAAAPPPSTPASGPAAGPDSGPAAGTTDHAGAGSASPEKAPPTAEEMVANTLAEDIATASYYELVTWCDQLGLDDSGSRSDLQARLAAHYKVTLPQAAAPGKRIVTVRSARQSEYFTQKDSDEKYVLLRGDVVVEVRDTKDDTLQVIKAASLTFNQTRRTMSAVGGVTYTLTRAGQTDTFTGESLDFDLDSSEAIFYGGSTRRVIKRNGTEVPYTFHGETITRVSNDTVILQKGGFTSSDTPADPLYQIRAGTVWLLGPSEWAVQDAVLMIGNVPLLYLPGFFWPGDDFFFNPNIGYKTREGSFVQTTTYLLGRKPPQDSPFSFLQLSGSGDNGYELEPHGLFLRKIPGTTAPKTTGNTLKLMADVYSRLGGMVGLDGNFSPIGTFRTSLGVSRSIFLDPTTNLYTPFLPAWPGTPPAPAGYNVGSDYWNSSSLFGLALPARFGLEGTLKLSAPTASLSTSFQLFSDPYFTSDFYNRTENGMLSALFTQAGSGATSSTTATTATAQQSNLAWDLTANADFTKLVNVPWIQTLSISTFNLHMTWQSFTNTGLSDPQADDPGRSFYVPATLTTPSISAVMSGNILSLGTPSASSTPPAPGAATPPTAGATAPGGAPAAGATAPGGPTAAGPGVTAAGATAAPGTPTTAGSAAGSAAGAAAQASPPTATASVTGTGPVGPATAGAPVSPSAPPAIPPAPDPGKGFRPPVEAVPPAPQAPKEAAVRIPFRGPDSQPDVAPQASPQSTFQLSYQVQPRATLDNTFNTAAWTTRDSVDYSFLYHTLETGGTSTVTAAASFLDRLADTSLTLSADGLWRYRFNPLSSYQALPDWSNLLITDQQQEHLAFRSIFQGTVRPFPAITEISTSSLAYRINARMYQVGLTPNLLDANNPQVTTLGPSWSPDAISEHSLASTLAVTTPATNDSVALTFQLPPLVPTITGRLDAAAGVLRARVQGGVSTPVTGVLYQPLVVSAGVDFNQAPATTAPSAPGTAAAATPAASATSGNALTASEELQFDLAGGLVSRSTSLVSFWGLSGQFVAQNTGSPDVLQPATVRVGYEAQTDPLYYWLDRVKLVAGLKTHWYLNLQNYIDNLFDFSPSLTLTVFKNLDFTFSSTSNNTRTYLYFPSLSGLPAVNPLVDLADSFNFFNSDDRRRSGFKIQTISVKAVQHFPDWDLSVQYQGSPQLITYTQNGVQLQSYQWSPTFSIQVQWNAVSEVKSNIHQEYTGTTTVPSLR